MFFLFMPPPLSCTSELIDYFKMEIQQIIYRSVRMDSQKYLSPKNQVPSEGIKQDHNNTSSSGYEYVAGLKHVGYVIGDPISSPSNGINSGGMGVNQRVATGLLEKQSKEVKKSTPTLGERTRMESRIDSRTGSRVEYSPSSGVIVHEYPSRPVRSPSPISQNPNANVVPPANFIYNSPGMQTTSRVVSYSPVRVPIEQPVTFPKPIAQQPLPMVPLAQYERCVSECKLWQQKYNELYSLYLKNQMSPKAEKIPINVVNNVTTSEEQNFLSRENRKLKERVREMERNQQKLVLSMEDIITRLVNKYRDSTIKESMLLVDRYRLEKKMGDKI